ncbi:6-carboxytetrahydropterin synthase [Macrococcus capreoli]
MTQLHHIKAPQHMAYYDGDIAINLTYSFTTNNRIFFPNGQHLDLHHHTYTFDISIQCPVNKYGLGIDFYKIERDYAQHIAPLLNAPILNEALPEMNTTVENIAYFIWQQFDQIINDGTIKKLTVYETHNHSVTLTEDMVK